MAQKEYFPSIGKIKFEGKESKNPLAYRYYDAEKVIMGKKMKDWLKFAMAWWHTLCAEGGDQFGGGTKTFPWNQGADALTVAKQKADAGFEIMEKLGIEYFCFHDVDLISEGNSIEEYEANMKAIVAYIKEKMQATGIKNLWGTANVFGHERCSHQPGFQRGGTRSRTNQERHRRHHRTGRKQLRVLGRTRRLHELAEHRHEA